MFKFTLALIATAASVNAWNPWDNPSGGAGAAQEYFGAANDFGQSLDTDSDIMSSDPWQSDWKSFEMENDMFKSSLGDGGSNVFAEALSGMDDIFTGRENYYNTINSYSGSPTGKKINVGLGDIKSMGNLGDIKEHNLGKGVNALGYGNDNTLSNGALSSDYGYGDLGYGSVGYGDAGYGVSGYGNTGYGSSYGGLGDASYGAVGGYGAYGDSYGAVGYGSNGYGAVGGYGATGYGADSYGSVGSVGYGATGYGADSYGSAGYGSVGYGATGYGESYGSAGYGSAGYGSAGYGDSYGSVGYGNAGYGNAGYSSGQMW